jgi:FtsZ-binding cell division protein ZapB
MIKETHISELQSAKDQMRHKVALLQDEVDRVKDENKYLINDLQHRNIEMEKRNKQLETELRDARKAINEFSRMRHHIDDRSPEQIKVLQEKVADLMSQLDKEKTESIRSRKKF